MWQEADEQGSVPAIFALTCFFLNFAPKFKFISDFSVCGSRKREWENAFLKVHNNLNLHIKTEHVTVLAVMLVPGSDRWKPLLSYIRSSRNRTDFMRKFIFLKNKSSSENVKGAVAENSDNY